MIHVHQNDRRPAAEAILRHGTSAVALDDATSVAFKATRMGRVDPTIEGTCHIDLTTTGRVEYRWADGDTSEPGTYWVEWIVTWNDGTPETFPTKVQDILSIWPSLEG